MDKNTKGVSLTWLYFFLIKNNAGMNCMVQEMGCVHGV